MTDVLFTPIQFGMRNLPLAAVDIRVVWGTIVWMMLAVWPHARFLAAAQVPYFVWVSIATVLQFSITRMNRAQRRRPNTHGSPHRESRRFLGKPPLSLPRMSGSTTALAPSPAGGCVCGR